MSGMIEHIFKTRNNAKPGIEPGSVVRLNSSSPLMTVVTEDHYKAQSGNDSLPDGSVCVSYWLNGFHMNVMPVCALTVVEPSKTETEDDA